MLTLNHLLILGVINHKGKIHGYGIREELRDFGVRISVAALYDGLERLRNQQYVIRYKKSPSNTKSPPRSLYSITATGREIFANYREIFVVLNPNAKN